MAARHRDSVSAARTTHEIEHGRKLAAQATEHVWGWGTPAGRRRFDRRAAVIAGRARLGLGVRVLEIGCGTGAFTEVFARTGASITAIDISPDLLERARERIGQAGNVTLVLGGFEQAAFDDSFDAVIGSSVLHHLDVGTSLVRIRELLRPGGVMCFAEPNYLNPQVFLERVLRFMPPFRSYVSPDERAFVRFQLARTLASHGFERIRIVPFDWLHPSVPSALIPGVERAGAFLESFPLLREGAGSLLIEGRRA